MLINVYEEETRIALTDNETLVGLHFQQTNRERTAGNIYKGLIVKVNPAFQAAFVDYGEKRNGFLSISDLNPALFKTEGGRGRSRIQSVLRAGQHVMVQVLKEGMREKGAALTTNLSLPGRYLVYTPNSDRSGVSRKIENTDKRHQLKDILAGLVGEEGAGVIIRTAGIDRPALDLKRDLAALKKEWTAIQDRNSRITRPGILHQEPGSIVRVLRDYFTDDVEEVWVDSPDAYQEALAYFKSTLPKFQKRLKLYVGDLSLFSAHNIEEQMEALGSSRVALNSGGGIVIESTEALVSIDVNSGKSNQESDIEDTALRTNLEAAKEVARQLRLRNLGGLIVVDFIDMFQAKNRSKVVQALTEALRYDKARTSIGSISQFGLLEMSRQRIDMELSLGLRHSCEACNGTGSVPTPQAYANSMLRKIRAVAASHRYAEIHGELPMEHANYMLNQKRESLRDLELEFDLKIHLFGDPALLPGHAVQLVGKSGDGAGREAPAEARQVAAQAPVQAQAQAQGEAGPGRRRRRRRGRGRGGELGAPLPAELGGPTAASETDAGDFDEGDGQEPVPPEAPRYVDELEDVGDEGAQEAPAAVFEPAEEVEEVEEVEAPSERKSVVHPEDNGGPQPGRLIQPGIPSGTSSGAVQFSSMHRITDPEVLQVADPPRRRPSPFRQVAAAVAPGAEIFASAHRGADGELATPGIAMPVLESAPPEAVVETERVETEQEEDAPLAQQPQAAAPRPEGREDAMRGRRPRGRGRGRGDNGAAKPRAAAAPPAESFGNEPNGNTDEPAVIEADEVNGNVLEPSGASAQPGERPHRRRRGRGRGRGRPAAAGAAS